MLTTREIFAKTKATIEETSTADLRVILRDLETDKAPRNRQVKALLAALGSAAPSLESFYKYLRHHIPLVLAQR